MPGFDDLPDRGGGGERGGGDGGGGGDDGKGGGLSNKPWWGDSGWEQQHQRQQVAADIEDRPGGEGGAGGAEASGWGLNDDGGEGDHSFVSSRGGSGGGSGGSGGFGGGGGVGDKETFGAKNLLAGDAREGVGEGDRAGGVAGGSDDVDPLVLSLAQLEWPQTDAEQTTVDDPVAKSLMCAARMHVAGRGAGTGRDGDNDGSRHSPPRSGSGQGTNPFTPHE